MPNIVLKNRDGVPVEHPTNRVRLIMSDGTRQEFVNAGSVPVLVPANIELDFSSGDMEIVPENGKAFSEITVAKPADLLPENLRKGKSVGGVVGECEVINYVETDILEELTFTSTLSELGYGFALEGDFKLLIGETYLVEWDGETHICEAKDANTLIAGAVFIGNGADFQLPGSDDPFAVAAFNGGMLIACLEDNASGQPSEHTIRIYQAERSGLEEVVVGLNMADGDQKIIQSKDGKVMFKATVTKPDTLIPENIAKDIVIGGVVGSLTGGKGTTKEIEPNFSAGDQTVVAGEDELWDKIIVKQPETLVPDNIASGVNIGGIEGKIEKALCVFTSIAVTSIKITTKNTQQTLESSVSVPLNSRIALVSHVAAGLDQSNTTNLNYAAATAWSPIKDYTITNGTNEKTISKASRRSFVNYGSMVNGLSVTFTVPGITIKTTDSGKVFHCDSSVTNIPKGGFFEDCLTITEADLQESTITTIPEKAFWATGDGSALKKVIFPNTLKSIGNQSFFYCKQLSEVKLPAGFESIGVNVFNSCFNLKLIDCSACTKVPTLGASAFASVPTSTLQIKVPAALYDEWIAATNWSTYASCIVAV